MCRRECESWDIGPLLMASSTQSAERRGAPRALCDESGESRHETGYDAHDSTRIRAAVGDRPPSPFASLRPLLKPHERDAADGLRKLAAALG
jgi:hypothetical protein